MSRFLLFLIGLLVVAALAFFCAHRFSAGVSDCADVAVAEHTWASAEVNGRTIRLTGTAPSVEARTRLVERLSECSRGGRVDDQAEVAVGSRMVYLNPVRAALAGRNYRWVSLGLQDLDLTLSGLAPSRPAMDGAASLADSLWTRGAILNRMRVAESPGERAAVACQAAFFDILESDTIQFSLGSVAVDTASQPVLDRLAAVFDDCPESMVTIEAHSDATGDADFNLRLSQQRAESVKAYLVGKGVLADRVASEGYGETRPIADNATPEGQARNRRVEFRVNS